MSFPSDEVSSVTECQTYEWCMVLPLMHEDGVYASSTFYLVHVEASFCVTLDAYKTYTVELRGDGLKTLFCSFNFEILCEKKWSNVRMYSTSGDFDGTNSSFILLTFDQDDLQRFHHSFKITHPVKMILTIWKNRYSKVDSGVQTTAFLNAKLYDECIVADFRRHFNSGTNDGDVKVRCGSRVIRAHSFILMARSEVLRDMLQKVGMIHLPNMDHVLFREFMDYIYTDVLPDMDFEKSRDLYELAEKYCLRNLKERCAEYLSDNLSLENSLELLLLADAHSDENFSSCVIDFIVKHKVFLYDDVWEPFCNEHTALANKVLTKSVKFFSSHKEKRCHR